MADVNNRPFLVQYSIGELAVQTGIAAGVVASFGFNQANDRIEVTALDDAVMPGFRVFPNPIQGGRLNIRTETGLQLESLGLYSATGQAVMQVFSPSPQEEWSLNVSALASGVYLLQLRIQDGRMAAYRVCIP